MPTATDVKSANYHKVVEWGRRYLCLEPLAQACPGRPAAFESKRKWKWPAKLNAPTPNSHSSSPLLHLHYKYGHSQGLGRIEWDGGGEQSYTRNRRFETAHRFRCRKTPAHMRQLLSIDYEKRVTHSERAPMRSRPKCGTDVEEVSIGRARRLNMV